MDRAQYLTDVNRWVLGSKLLSVTPGHRVDDVQTASDLSLVQVLSLLRDHPRFAAHNKAEQE